MSAKRFTAWQGTTHDLIEMRLAADGHLSGRICRLDLRKGAALLQLLLQLRRRAPLAHDAMRVEVLELIATTCLLQDVPLGARHDVVDDHAAGREGAKDASRRQHACGFCEARLRIGQQHGPEQLQHGVVALVWQVQLLQTKLSVLVNPGRDSEAHHGVEHTSLGDVLQAFLLERVARQLHHSLCIVRRENLDALASEVLAQ